MKRFALLLFSALAFDAAISARYMWVDAQSYTLTQISAAKLYDSNRQPLNGTIIVTLTDSTDTPVTYTPQGGSPSTAPFTTTVKNGVIQLITGFLPFTVPAAATTSPAGIVYRIQTVDQNSNVIWTFPKTPINQQYYSVDGYIAQAAQPISGYGPPSVPKCAGGAQYTDTNAPTVPWACTILTQPDNSTVWTQNPSLAAQCPGMAIAYPLIGNPYCMSPAQAYLLPGYVLGNSGATPSMPHPIVQPSGGGSTPAPPAYAVQFASSNASALAADPYITVNPTSHVLGVGTGQVPGQVQVNGGCTGACATLTSPDGVTWNMGTNLSVTNNVTTAKLTVGGCTSGQVPRGDGSGICNTPLVIGGATGQAQINNGGVLGGVPVTMDSSGNVKATGAVSGISMIASGQPLEDIRHPSFAGGANCNGDTSHDSLPALQATLNALPLTGGEILIPGSPNYCWISNPNAIVWPAFTGTVTLKIQGKLGVGTTFTLPQGVSVNLMGQSAGSLGNFAGAGRAAVLQLALPSGTTLGTLGTAINPGTATVTYGSTSVTGSGTSWTSALNGTKIAFGLDPVNIYTISSVTSSTAMTLTSNYIGNTNGATRYYGIANTFTPSTMSGLVSGTVISVGSQLQCAPTNVVRSSASVNNVTATMSSSCHEFIGANLTVAGMSDASYNGTFAVKEADWVYNTVTWTQSGTAGSTSGGTITGLNEDTVETVPIQSCSGSQCTAYFYYSHAATDSWAVVPLAWPMSDMNHQLSINGGTDLIKDINVGGEIFLGQTYNTKLENVAAQSNVTGSIAEYTAYEVAFSSFIRFTGDSTAGTGWAIHMTQPYNQAGSGSGPIYLRDTNFGVGIKVDHGAAGIFINGGFNETTTNATIRYDPSNYVSGIQQSFAVENTGQQDNGSNYVGSMIYQTVPSSSSNAAAQVFMRGFSTNTGVWFNDYFDGYPVNNIPTTGGRYGMNIPRGTYGTYNNGRFMEGELRGIGANAPLGVVPTTMQPIVTNPSSWSGSCTVTTGQLDPYGTFTAGMLTGSGSVQLYSANFTPTVGDVIMFGGWSYSPSPKGNDNAGGSGTPIAVSTGTTNVLFTNSLGGTTGAGGQQALAPTSPIQDDWWHPEIGYGYIGTVTGAASFTMRLACGSASAQSYWQPFLSYLSAASTTATWSSGATSMTIGALSHGAALMVGSIVNGAGIAPNTLVTSISGSTVNFNNPTTASGSGTAVTFSYPLKEILRWRAQMLHGYVSSGAVPGVLYSGYPISAATGYNITGVTPTAGHYLRGNGTNYIDGTIQAGDLPTPARGTQALTAGTATVSTSSACAVGSSCVYKLTNCTVGGTVGTLSVGTVSAGTSFVINSSSATDTSTVCWQIN